MNARHRPDRHTISCETQGHKFWCFDSHSNWCGLCGPNILYGVMLDSGTASHMTHLTFMLLTLSANNSNMYQSPISLIFPLCQQDSDNIEFTRT